MPPTGPDPLEPVELASGSTVSRLGFGTAPLATVYWNNDETTAVRTASRAIESGIRLLDTAPFYGLGECEERLGAALARRPDVEVTIATKVGRLLSHGPDGSRDARFDFSRDAAMRSIESSLDRLGVDRVNIVHIHDPDDHIEEALAGTEPALTQLRHEGVIDAVSVGTNSSETALTFLERADLDCVMVAGRYTLLDQAADGLISRCADREVAYIAAGVFNSGVLADPSADAWYDYAPVEPSTLERAVELRDVCANHGVSLRSAALAFALTDRRITAVVVGMARPEEVDENLELATTGVPDELWAELEAEGLIPHQPAGVKGRP